jgi:hypothetical protein
MGTKSRFDPDPNVLPAILLGLLLTACLCPLSPVVLIASL